MGDNDSLDRLSELVMAFIAALPAEDTVMGIEYFDSYRGPVCSGCHPFWSEERNRYEHVEGCPLAALIAWAARQSGQV